MPHSPAVASHLDERLVTACARSLGEDGLPFTDRQLWYAVCARLEGPEVTLGGAQVASGALMIAVGIVAGALATIFVALLVPVGMVVLGTGVQNRRRERNRPRTRALAVGYDEFVRDTLVPLGVRGVALPGLLPGDGLPPAGEGPAGEPGADLPLVVCDRGETAALLDAVAATTQPPPWRACTEAEAAPLLPGARAHAVHDADPRGCALPLRLAGAGAAGVVDCGLRPDDLRVRHVQVIEGAEAVVPAELSAILHADEVVWLAGGKRVELAVLSTRELVDGLHRALTRPPVAPPGAAPAGVALAGGSLLPEAVAAEAQPA